MGLKDEPGLPGEGRSVFLFSQVKEERGNEQDGMLVHGRY